MDVARRAFCDVLLFLAAAVVNELCGDSFGFSRQREGSRRAFVTSVAVFRDWFLRLPVTTEARRVIVGDGFESRCAWRVTHRAVVIALDQVLMRIVWKVDRELQP